MTTGMEHLSTEEVAQLAQLAVTELARRTGQMQPPAPQDPLRAILAAAGGGQPPSWPAQPQQRAPGTPLMPPRPTRPPPERNFSVTAPLPPGTPFMNANTDPEAAAIFAQRQPRLDGVPGVAGNGVGQGPGVIGLEP